MAENIPIGQALDALAAERHIEKTYLLEQLEDALAKTYKHVLNLEGEATVIISRDTNEIYVLERVGIGEPDPETGEYPDYEERDVTPSDVSRMAALTARSVIKKIIRDASRETIYREYKDRIGELMTGTVLQTTRDFTILKVSDGVEAELPHFNQKYHPEELNERPRDERYRHNQRLKSIIVDVRNPNPPEGARRVDPNRPTIVVSRTSPDFLRRLFELEVPEIYDGIVQIEAIAREPGARSKVAVSSTDPNLDPVGACVGPKGSRVRMVVEELHNERVDVIQYSEDPAMFVEHALSPAKISKILVYEDKKYVTAIVEDDQLSLAIGKDGQNARLAAKLTGWHIDIKSTALSADIPEAAESLAQDTIEEVDPDEGRCEYTLKDGSRCRNHARPDSHYCGIHEKKMAKEKAA
ncbi:MAG: transcription termination factor NusA [Coriobacteriales bacterium]|jgi:N utilization substance protein A|nr:transcription termination factor NusA [Coriobacteriales bacterium]